MKFKIGDLVQDYENNMPKDGVVTEEFPAEKEYSYNDFKALSMDEREAYYETTTECIQIKWDDGTSTKEKSYNITARDDQFQREFRLACETAQNEIYAKCGEAAKLLDEAVDLSEKYGIPFNSGISFLGQSYIPESMKDKFPEVDKDFMMEVAEAHSEYGDPGWEHSAVCY